MTMVIILCLQLFLDIIEKRIFTLFEFFIYKRTNDIYFRFWFVYLNIQGVPGGMDKTSGDCSLC